MSTMITSTGFGGLRIPDDAPPAVLAALGDDVVQAQGRYDEIEAGHRRAAPDHHHAEAALAQARAAVVERRAARVAADPSRDPRDKSDDALILKAEKAVEMAKINLEKFNDHALAAAESALFRAYAAADRAAASDALVDHGRARAVEWEAATAAADRPLADAVQALTLAAQLRSFPERPDTSSSVADTAAQDAARARQSQRNRLDNLFLAADGQGQHHRADGPQRSLFDTGESADAYTPGTRLELVGSNGLRFEVEVPDPTARNYEQITMLIDRAVSARVLGE